jgi:hypothetical protein
LPLRGNYFRKQRHPCRVPPQLIFYRKVKSNRRFEVKEVFILYFFYLFDFAVKNLAAGAAAWMPLFPEVIAAKRQLLAIRQDAGFWHAQGIGGV